jgi:stage II sporulation protein D
MLNLRSANFDVTAKENAFSFTVRGYGHLVGMSQYGANYMAQQGSDYKEILKWYYKGTEIS